jgi:hypothetical protein
MRIERDFINILYRIISNLRISNPVHKVTLHYDFNIATFQSGILQTPIHVKRDQAFILQPCHDFDTLMPPNPRVIRSKT